MVTRGQKKPIEEKNRANVSARTSLTFEACAAASSSLSKVSVFMVILFYISTRSVSLQLFREIYLPIWEGIYDSPHAACLHIAQSFHFNSYEIYTLYFA